MNTKDLIMVDFDEPFIPCDKNHPHISQSYIFTCARKKTRKVIKWKKYHLQHKSSVSLSSSS